MDTIAMAVVGTDSHTVHLSHETPDDEHHEDGYTGARMTLWFNESEIGIPLAIGQVVQVTLAATADQVPLTRIVADQQGQPSHVEDFNPETGQWER